jgi:spermidine synthase
MLETTQTAPPVFRLQDGPSPGRWDRLRLAWVVSVGGGVLMALEILASRVLAPHFGSSVYVWGSIISVFLAALSTGYVWGGRLADRNPTLAGLGRQLALAAIAQGLLLLFARPAVAWLAAATGNSNWGTLVTTALLFGVPSVMLGVISPYAVRLKVEDHAHLGGTVGGLYALSTAGSLAGTLGCTFALVPYLDLNEGLALLLGLTAITSLVALGAPAFRREWAAGLAAAAMLLLALGGAFRSGAPPEGLLFEQMTPYQTIQVRDEGGVRSLTSDSIDHGAMNLETGITNLSYPRVAAGALVLQPKIDSMLVLGLGAGFAGTHLQRYLPELQADFVEIDPAMAEVAKRFFRFEEGPKRKIHIADARRFLDQSAGKWDYIYCDTYIGLSVPFHLTTREFLLEVRDHLEPGGVFGLNLAGTYEAPFPRAIYRTVADVFPFVRTYYVPGSGNLLVLATADPPPPGTDLQARAHQLDAQYGFDLPLAQVLAKQNREKIDFADTPILVDEFAPVDHLIHLNAASMK